MLDELRRGGTNAEIAVRLGVSPDAVKFHISNMLAKLALEDRQQLASWERDAERSRLRALLAPAVALGSLARPLVWAGAGTVVLAVVAAVLVIVQGNGEPVPVAPLATPSPTSSTVPGTPSPQPTPLATVSPTPTPQETAAPSPAPTPTATQTAIEYVPLTLGEPRPLPPGATLFFRRPHGCHGPQDWLRAIATETGELVWDNPFAKLPAINSDNWGPENWGPQLEHVSASGQTLVALVCEHGTCMAFDRVDGDAVEGLWGSVDAGETWERWGEYPEGGTRGVSEEDVAFVDADGRVKGLRSGEEWVPPERLPSPWVRSWVDGRLGHEEREPGQLDRFLHYSDQGAILGGYSWGGEGSYESHRPLWIIDHLEGHLFVGFLGSDACGDATRAVLVDFGSRSVHIMPAPDRGSGLPILYTARLTEPQPPLAATPIPASEPHPVVARSPTFDGPPGVYTDIAVTFSGACALTEEGEAVCWDIESGDVWDTPPGVYTFITARHSIWCAITEEGGIRCWGKAGRPVPEHDPDPSRDAPPGRFSALSFISGITTPGSSYGCALTEEGEPVCWGTDDGPLPLPDLPPGVYSAVSLDSSYVEESSHYKADLTACATTEDGNLVCWRGTDSDGRLEEAVEHTPGDYVDVQVLEYAICAVAANGRARCADWVGDGSTGYTGLAAGGDFVCATTEAGGIQCAHHGLLSSGIGGYSGKGSVMQPPTPAPDGRYEAVSMGSSRALVSVGSGVAFSTYACALTDLGEVDCWRSTENKVAYPDPPPGRYVAVSDGFGHTCALTEDGHVACWGWNNYGQTDVPEGRYTAISAGFSSTCAVNEAGEAACWGHLPDGESWRAPSQERYRAISTGYYSGCGLTVEGRPACPGWQPLSEVPPTSFVAVTVSWTGHACVLSEEGEVACWGGNSRGESDVPPGSWRAIDAGDHQTCGIDDAGRAVCWGARSGQLPDAPAGGYVAVATSGYGACLLTDAGQVYCRDREDWESGAGLRRLDVDARIVEISVGLHRGCALTEAGSVTCWGDTEYWNDPFLNRHGYQPR